MKDVFGFDFKEMELSNKNEQIKLSKEALANQLKNAIIDQDAALVERLLSPFKDKELKSLRIEKKHPIEIAIGSFDESVMNVLLSKGIKPINYQTLYKKAYLDDNVEALKWIGSLAKKNNVACSDYFYHSLMAKSYTKNLDVYEFFLGQIKDKVSVYNHFLCTLLNKSIESNRVSLFEAVLDKCKLRYHSNDMSVMSYLLYNYCSNFSYNDCSSLQKMAQQSNVIFSELHKSFPLKNNNGLFYHHSLIDLVAYNNVKILTELIQAPNGQQAVTDLLSKTSHLKRFLKNSSVQQKEELFTLMPDFFNNWRDEMGENVAHCILHKTYSYANVSKADALFLYKFNKDLLLEADHTGKTPVDNLDDDFKKTLENKILRRSLNDQKIGLVHNRTAKTKKRM